MDDKILKNTPLANLGYFEKSRPPRKIKSAKKKTPPKCRFPALEALSSDSSRLPHPLGRILGKFRPIWADFGPCFSFWSSLCHFSCRKSCTFSSTDGISYTIGGRKKAKLFRYEKWHDDTQKARNGPDSAQVGRNWPRNRPRG